MIRVLFVLVLLCICLYGVTLTRSEQVFLSQHPKISLGSDKNWLPYVFINDKGEVDGYVNDLLSKVNALTGANFKIEASSLKDALARAKTKSIDGLATDIFRKEAQSDFNFSKVYRKQEVVILAKHNNPLNITSPIDLVNKTIAIQKGNVFVKELLQKIDNVNLVYYNSLDDVLSAVAFGNADATIGMGAIQYLQNEYKSSPLNTVSSFNQKMQLRFSIRKDWPLAMTILNKGLNAISLKEKKYLQNKWFNKFYFSSSTGFVKLSSLEKQYVQTKKRVKVCIDASWQPFDYFNINHQNNKLLLKFSNFILNRVGLSAEIVYTKNWEESLTYIKEKKCDMIPVIYHDTQREKYINFTSSYINYPLVISTHKDTLYLHNLNGLKNKKIAVIKKSAIKKLFENRYPSNEFIYVQNMLEGLEKVEKKEVYGYIDILPGVLPVLQPEPQYDIKINRALNIDLPLSVGIRKDDTILHYILERSVQSISSLKKHQMLKEMLTIEPKESLDYRSVFEVFVVFFLIIGVILYWNLQLKRGIKKALKKNKEQESLIYYYAKQDSMSDLVGNISHQWKQPLSELSSMLLYIETKLFLKEEVTTKVIESTSVRSREIINFMSETVDTFNNFYKTETHTRYINLLNVINDIIFMIKGSLEENNIKVDIHSYHEDIILQGNSNELKQVLLAIINNAKDIFLQRETPYPKLDILIYKKEKWIIIDIEDNAGGIDTSNLDKIFDISCFSSKMGAGMGLYISKQIIEDKFKGKLYAQNRLKGALFRIELLHKGSFNQEE